MGIGAGGPGALARSSEERAPRFRPPPLLGELLDGRLDAGYAEAAARRATAPRHAGTGARTFRVLAVLTALACGLVFAVAWNQTHRAAPAEQVLHDQLVERARAAQAAAAGLEAQVTSAAADVASLQNAALAGDARGRSVAASLQDARVAAGTLAVTGPGLVVRIGDPSAPDTAGPTGRAGSTPIGTVRLVSDLDVRDVVNVLWSAGAQAVAVNQVRITPLSAIRAAGSDVLVDFRIVSSPYTVSAIGDGDALAVAFADSAVAAHLAALRSNSGVTFEFDPSGRVSLPAGVVAPVAYASAAGPTPSAASSAASSSAASSSAGAAPTGRGGASGSSS